MRNVRYAAVMMIIVLTWGKMDAQQPLILQLPDSGSPSSLHRNVLPTPLSYTATKAEVSYKRLIIPASLVAYGFVALENDGLKQLNYSTKAELREDHAKFSMHADNYLQFTPALAVYALNIAGVKGKNNLRDRSMIYGLATVLSTAVVFSLKNITHVERPDHSGFNSFPSGHTTIAFASAEFLRQEYKDVSLWYGVAGYAVATATGALRMYNNKHWFSDVVAGAGFGILSAKVVYWVYPWIEKKLFHKHSASALVCF